MRACPSLAEALGLDHAASAVVSLVGGGGKTTAMFGLAAELKGCGKKVLVTTTTNIGVPDPGQADILLLEGCADFQKLAALPTASITCLGNGIIDGCDVRKLQSIAPAFIDELHGKRLFDFILVEADGAKRKPIKAPADYEPVIPATTTLTIGVIGLDCLGKTVSEDNVHRSELFCTATGARMGDEIDASCLVRLIGAAQGLFKGAPVTSRNIVLLNKADTEELAKKGEQIARQLSGAGIGCVISSLQQAAFYTLS